MKYDSDDSGTSRAGWRFSSASLSLIVAGFFNPSFSSFHIIQRTVTGNGRNQLRPESARGVSARGALGSDQEVVQLGAGGGGGGVAEGKAAGVDGGYKEEILTVSWV